MSNLFILNIWITNIKSSCYPAMGSICVIQEEAIKPSLRFRVLSQQSKWGVHRIYIEKRLYFSYTYEGFPSFHLGVSIDCYESEILEKNQERGYSACAEYWGWCFQRKM